MKKKHVPIFFLAAAAFLFINLLTAFIATGFDVEAFEDPAKQAATIAESPIWINISMLSDFLWYISFAVANILIGRAVIRKGNKVLGTAIIILAVVYSSVGAYAALAAIKIFSEIPSLYEIDPVLATQKIIDLKSYVFDQIWGTWNNITAFLLWSAIALSTWSKVKIFSTASFITATIHGATTLLNLTGKSEVASQSTIVYILLDVLICLCLSLTMLLSKKSGENFLA